ncbi:MAG TPA: CAP domain-containing protein [Gemmataceae bacterium]|nr:CAP domain-containing protein [Gemmataceae bacterium]
MHVSSTEPSYRTAASPSGLTRWLSAAAGLAVLAAVGGGMFLLLPHESVGERRGLPPPASASAAPSVDADDKNGGDKPRRSPAPSDGVVIYPVDGQEGVPTAFPGHEVPDPIPEAKGGVAGYPATATFPPQVAVRKAHATLLDADGGEVEAWASSPQEPADPRHPRAQQNTICLIAKKPLAPGRSYTVSMSAESDGKKWAREWKFTTASADDGVRPPIDAFVKRLNGYRTAAGAGPVIADAALSVPCTAHARYMERNFDQKNLNWNDEDRDLPGATEAGRSIARRSLVDAGGGAESSADWCVASLPARAMVLDAGVRNVGVGAAAHARAGYVWVIDVQGAPREPPAMEAVLFPGPDQRDVPTAYPSGEQQPVPDPDDDARPGYAITALFPPRTAVADVKAQLTDEDGKEVKAYVSTPAHPAIDRSPQRGIGLVPMSVLQAGAKYTVAMSAKVGGEPWARTWSFHTADDSDEAEAAYAAAAMESLNTYRRTAGLAPVALDEKRSKGCRLHAKYLVQNMDQPAVQGLGMHEEDSSLRGTTAEGKRAGRVSVISREPDAGAAVDAWIDTLFHRVPLLDPDLKTVGYACVRLPDQGYICVMDAEPGM